MSQPPRKKRERPPGWDEWAAQYRAFKATPEGREANRQLTRFLESLGRGQWGFVLYHTVFTAESDKEVPLAIEKLEAFVKKEVELDLKGTQLDPRTNERVCEKWQVEVVEARGRGLEGVRELFLERLREGKRARPVCILLDEKGVRALMDTDVDGDEDLFLTLVDGGWVPRTGDPNYPGWMKVSARILMRLYNVLGTNSLWQNWCVLREIDKDGAYVYLG